MEDINECTYDPPYVGKGSSPGWAAGSSKNVEQITEGIPDYSAAAADSDYDEDYGEYYDYRKRRSAGRQKRFDMAGGYDGKILILTQLITNIIQLTMVVQEVPTHMATPMEIHTHMIMLVHMIQVFWNV